MTYRDQWVEEVFRTPLITDSTRVALLALVPEMDESGLVSFRRQDLAARLGRSDRRVGDRIANAIDAGYLRRISRGQRNGLGRYQATLPGDSSGHPGVPKSNAVFRTPGGPEEKFLQDGFKPEENPTLGDTRGSRRNTVHPPLLGTPGGPEDVARIYKARARARISTGRDDTSHRLPDADRPVGTPPPVDESKISQSAQRREACRWLKRRYHGGLTDQEATAVIDEVARRAARPIRNLVPYLAAMKEGDLADIVGAVMDATDRTTQTDDHEPASRPALAVVPPWCGACESDDHRFIDLPDGRVARCPRCHPNATRNAS